jgi:hypothetical protein
VRSSKQWGQVLSPTYFHTGGDLPAVGQANLHAPDEYQPHPMHVWPNSPQFRKSRLNVENQTGRFAVQPRGRIIRAIPTSSVGRLNNTNSHVQPCHATTGSPLAALSLQGNHGLKNLRVTGWSCSSASIVGVDGKPSNAWSSLARSQRPTDQGPSSAASRGYVAAAGCVQAQPQ